MPLADLLRREADSWSRQAALLADDAKKDAALVSVKLRNIAGIVEVHGLAGLHGYLACLHFSHSVTDKTRNVVIDTVERILRGR